MWAYLVLTIVLIIAFYVGVIFGINDCKRSYGISKGVSPAEFNESIRILTEQAYAPYSEVE